MYVYIYKYTIVLNGPRAGRLLQRGAGEEITFRGISNNVPFQQGRNKVGIIQSPAELDISEYTLISYNALDLMY